LRATAGNENGKVVSLVMASVVGAIARGHGVSNQIPRYIKALRHARQPQIPPVVNKMG